MSTPFHDCGDGGFTCLDPSSGCALVEAGTKTTVTASANAYDPRPGAAYGNNGCMEDGCKPALTRDGETDDTESRWSCAPSMVAGGKFCEIEFMFESPQDIVEVQVAFWKGDERTRTLEVRKPYTYKYTVAYIGFCNERLLLHSHQNTVSMLRCRGSRFLLNSF